MVLTFFLKNNIIEFLHSPRGKTQNTEGPVSSTSKQ